MGDTPATRSTPVRSAGNTTAIVLVAGLFAMWGLAQWLYNAQFSQFSTFFAFDSTQVAWTLSLFNIAYFVLAVPAALFHRSFGYKLGLLFALSIFAVSSFLLYLAIIQHGFVFFLGAVVLMGSGWAWLETGLNPLAVEAGRPQTAVVRLNLAQAFNAVGVLVGCYVAQWLIDTHYKLTVGAMTQTVARPYILVGLGVLVLAFVVERTKLPSIATDRASGGLHVRAELRSLLVNRNFQIAAAALCAYSVALMVIWSSNYNYRMHELSGANFGLVSRVFFWFAVGRFTGCALMCRIDPVRLLQGGAGLSLIALVLAAALGGMAGWVCLISTSFLLAIAYPTIFSTALRQQAAQTKLASGLLVAAAGIGGAVAALLVTPALQTLNIRLVVLLAVPFVAVILAYATVSRAKAAAAR